MDESKKISEIITKVRSLSLEEIKDLFDLMTKKEDVVKKILTLTSTQIKISKTF